MSFGRFIVTGFVEAFADKTIRQFFSLCQEIESSDNLEIYPSIAGVLSEVVFINKLLRDVRYLDAQILSMIHERF